MTMNPYAQATFSTAIATALLGVFVLIRGRNNTLHRVFAIYSLAIASWAAPSGFYTIVESTELALLFGRIQHIGAIFIPILLTKFILVLTHRTEQDKSWLHSAYLFSLVLFLLLPTSLFIDRVFPVLPLRQVTHAGPLYFLMIIFFYTYVSRSLFLLYHAYREADPTSRRKLGYLLWSSLVGYIGGSLAFLYVYDIPHPIILAYMPYAVLVYVMGTAYAIIKHHLLDINIVFKRSLIYSILVASLTLEYLIIVWFLERFFQTAIGYRSIPATVFALLTIAILFQPLKDRIQRFVDFRFFKGTLESLAEEKQKLQEEVRRTDQLRIAGTLASGLAHEIKNPLTSIKTFTKYLPERKNEGGFIEKFQEVVGSEVDRIEKLTKDLLDFTKPKPPSFEGLDVHKILDKTLGLIEHDLTMSNIRPIRSYQKL